jgi:uncharacterized protein YcbX
MFKIKELYVYPIKSLKGISISSAQISETGISYDRYWMLVDESGKFITQREIPLLATFQTNLSPKHLTVLFEDKKINIPKVLITKEKIACTIWEDDQLICYKEKEEINAWFSEILNQKVFLVRMAPSTKRAIKQDKNSFINFVDDNQYLLLGQASLDYLNSKLEKPISSDRFRPNIVFENGTAHIEDTWKTIVIGNSKFSVTKACARCKIIAINQENGLLGKEPLKTLASYRLKDKKVYFGQYLKLISSTDRTLKIGDELNIL